MCKEIEEGSTSRDLCIRRVGKCLKVSQGLLRSLKLQSTPVMAANPK